MRRGKQVKMARFNIDKVLKSEVCAQTLMRKTIG
jgi:hypothetical protein